MGEDNRRPTDDQSLRLKAETDSSPVSFIVRSKRPETDSHSFSVLQGHEHLNLSQFTGNGSWRHILLSFTE